MARFLCAVHAPDAAPLAFALLEVMDGPDGPTYAVRDLREVGGGDARQTVLDALAAEPQYAGQTTVVTTGGQRSADAFHDAGPSAVAVTLGAGDVDAHDVSAQVLVDTFERLYRAGAVEVPGTLDAASTAIEAMYSAADLDAAAPDSDRDAEGDLDDDGPDGPSAVTVEQSGGEANVSTETIKRSVTADEASAAAVDAREPQARVAASTGADVDLGDAEPVALALALGCWYGETSRDGLPQTDRADEAIESRANRPDRRA